MICILYLIFTLKNGKGISLPDFGGGWQISLLGSLMPLSLRVPILSFQYMCVETFLHINGEKVDALSIFNS